MSRQCEICGKKRMLGHTVSHANNKSVREFRPQSCHGTGEGQWRVETDQALHPVSPERQDRKSLSVSRTRDKKGSHTAAIRRESLFFNA